MVAEVYDAFISAGAPEDKARAAAKAVAEYDGRLVAIEGRVAAVQADVTLLKRMVGTNTAITVAVLLKLLVH